MKNARVSVRSQVAQFALLRHDAQSCSLEQKFHFALSQVFPSTVFSDFLQGPEGQRDLISFLAVLEPRWKQLP